MDGIIDEFVRNVYSDGAQEDIYQSFGLFRVFNYLKPFTDIQEIIMMESYMMPSAMQDAVTNTIIDAQDYLLDRHGIKLTEDATLAFRGIVLRNLFKIQRIEDPVPYLRVIESMGNDQEKIARIMTLLSEVPETSFLQVLDEVRPVTLRMMSDYLYAQEDGNDDRASVVNKKVLEYVHLFKEVFGISPGVRVILDSDVVPGEEFSVYLPLFQELRSHIVDEKLLVELLLFMLLYSSDGVTDPVKMYSDYSSLLVPNIDVGARLGRTIAAMYTQLQRHRQENKP